MTAPHDTPNNLRHLFLADGIAGDPADAGWRAHLAALPEAAPSDALWQRVQQAHAERFGTAAPARRTRWPWMASAAALAVAVIATQLLPPQGQAPSSVPSVADVAQTDQAPAIDASSRASLLRLDDELARAYEQNADEARLQALWQARTGVVDSLATADPAELVQL